MSATSGRARGLVNYGGPPPARVLAQSATLPIFGRCLGFVGGDASNSIIDASIVEYGDQQSQRHGLCRRFAMALQSLVWSNGGGNSCLQVLMTAVSAATKSLKSLLDTSMLVDSLR